MKGLNRSFAALALSLGAWLALAASGRAQGVDINAILKAAGQGGGAPGGGASGGQSQQSPALKAPAQSASTDLISVSADIVEISGSLETQIGFSWTQSIDFAETKVPFPGIISVGEIARKTALGVTLRALQSEGKAQLLSNPKVIVKSGEQANFVVGGEQPFPVVNNQGTGVDFKKFGVILNVLPVLLQDDKGTIAAQLQLEVSNPDFSKALTVGGSAVPSLVTRQMQTTIEVHAGDTLVLGGLKSSQRNVAKTRVPILGHIPILGLLFTSSDVSETTSSLYLFVTLDKAK